MSAGLKLGRWRLKRPLGRGSFGSVWQAEDAEGRQAAVKLLEAPPGDEVLSLARVCHPAIPMVLDAGGSPRPFLAMSLAMGLPLSQMIRAGRAPESAAVSITAILADALSEIHAAGVVHGDLKPANVVVGSVKQQQVVLVDFGMTGSTTGGTFHYAAPERLAGQPPSPAADVYALGLLLWEMLHGHLPWAEVGLSASLSHRRQGAPSPREGSPWLTVLLQRILDPEPKRRPTASDIADTLAAHGVHLLPITSALIRQRAEAAHVHRSHVDPQLSAWLSDGGCLAICGPAGSGRSHLLNRATTQLQATGSHWVRLTAAAQAWAAIEDALSDPSLPGVPVPLPDISDPEERAERSARLLEERAPDGLAILVDEIELLDDGSQLTLRALARRGAVRLCVAGDSAPSWSTDTVQLTPLSQEDLHTLVRQVLGATTPLEELARALYAACGGIPKLAVGLLARGIEDGAIVRRARRWLVDGSALSALAASEPAAATQSLSGDDAWLGGLLAAARRPLRRERLTALSGRSQAVTDQTIAVLLAQGLIRIEHGRIITAGLSAQRALATRCPDPVDIFRRLLADRQETPVDDDPLLGWYLVGAQDVDQARILGTSAIDAVARRDIDDAERLSAALFALAPTPELAAARIDALRIVGQHQAAAEVGTTLPPALQDGVVLLALARAHLARPEGADDAAATLERARSSPSMDQHTVALSLLEAKLCIQQGRPADAVRLARPGCAVAPPGGGIALDRWLELCGVCAQSLKDIDHLTEGIALLDDVPSALGRGRTARAMLDGIHARLLWHAGRFTEAARALERAGAEDSGLAAMDRARMLNNSGLVFYQTGARLQALACWEESLLLFERLDGETDRIRVSNNLCVGYREVGRWERARQAGAWAVEAAARSGNAELEAMAAGNMGDLFLEQGAHHDARTWFDRASALAIQHDLADEQVELARRQATLAHACADPRTEDLARAGLQMATTAESRLERSRCQGLLAVCLAKRGEAEDAERLLHQAVEVLREDGAAGELAWLRLLAAEAWQALTWSRRALMDCDRVIAYADELGLVPLRDRAALLRAEIAASLEPAADRRRLELLMSLAARVAAERDEQALLASIASAAMELLEGERSFVLLCEGDEFEVAARSGAGTPSTSVVSRVLASRREVIAADLSERSDLRQARSVVALNLRSAMCVPMLIQDDLLGAIYVDSRTASEQQLSACSNLMRSLAAYAAIAVTNHRQLQEADRRAARAAELVHDLRAPISSMVTLAQELLLQYPGAAAAREIIAMGSQAGALAEGLLSRKRSSRPFDAARSIEAVCRAMKPLARSADRSIACTTQPVSLTGDPADLRRITTNLVTNALRHGAGTIEVSLSVADRAVLTVRDHGAGIPEDILPAIFETGVSSGGTTSHGLGMAIVHRLVTESGGEIEAGNHTDGGAIFTASWAIAS